MGISWPWWRERWETVVNPVPCFAMIKRPVVALDLDGVLVDSARECFRILTASSPDLVPSELEDRWLADRGRARIVADFFRLAAAIRGGTVLPAAGGLPEGLLYPPDVDERVALFYETRRRVVDADEASWFGLHRAYPGAVDAVREIAGRAEVFVATSKDTSASLALLDWFGYDIPKDRVFGRETGDGKAALLRLVAARAGTQTDSVLFVDDHLGNLRNAATTGARCLLASWGYNVSGEREQAAREGFLVLGPADFAGLPALPGDV